MTNMKYFNQKQRPHDLWLLAIWKHLNKCVKPFFLTQFNSIKTIISHDPPNDGMGAIVAMALFACDMSLKVQYIKL